MTAGRPAGHVVEIRADGRVPLTLLVTERLPVGRGGEGLVVPDDLVSRRHCELRVDEHGLVVADSASTNGTFVNDRRITEPTSLRPGDVVRVGATTITVDPALGPEQPRAGTGLHDTVAGRGPELRTTGDATTPTELVPAPEPDVDELRASVVGGTITMVFSDIVDSTAWNDQVGDAVWFRLLERHNDVIAHQVSRYRGSVVKSQGDGYLLTFPSARHAVLFAISVQRDLDRLRRDDPSFPLHVRVGVHTGEVIQEAGDLFGKHVNLAARVAMQAQADEITASQLVHDLTAPMGDLEFGEPRMVELKGFSGTHLVHPVSWR